MTLEEALRFHPAWGVEDRDVVRNLLEEYFGELDLAAGDGSRVWENLRWYVPPSGGYVAGHLGRGTLDGATNLAYFYAGFVRLELSPSALTFELTARVAKGERRPSRSYVENPICPDCWLAHAGECP